MLGGARPGDNSFMEMVIKMERKEIKSGKVKLHMFWGFVGFLGLLGYLLKEPLYYAFFMFFLFFIEIPVLPKRK